MKLARNSIIFATLVGLILGLAANPALAQIQSRLTGTVSDNTGAFIVAAKVDARNISTGIVYTTETNETGTYVFPALVAGEYEVTCGHTGFKAFRRPGVVLETSLARTVNIVLEVGDVTETVEVNAETPLLESETSTVGQLIERSTVLNMPLESRRMGALVRLMGNVAFTSEGGEEQIPVFSMAGGRGRNQAWVLDGGVTQTHTLVNQTLVFNPPAESIQEFKIEASNYSAEFGRAGGGLIIMTTRSGTNEYHGALYEFFRNDKLDARTFFAPSKAPLRYNIFGGSIGGPVVKNRTFFFFNYEGTRRRDGRTVSNYDVPNPAEITGDFSSRTDVTVLDPLTAQPFQGNIIPAGRIDPVGQAFAKLYPAPNTNSNPARAPVDNFIGNVSDKLSQNFYTSRLDHNVGDNDRLYLRYSFVEAPTSAPGLFSNEFADPRARTVSNQQHNAVASWIHHYSASVFGEARFLYSRKERRAQSLGTGTGMNGQLGLKGVNLDTLASVEPTGLTALGSTNQGETEDPIVTIAVPFNMTWVKSSHQIQTGFEFRYSRFLNGRNNLAGGRFQFNDRATRNGLASLLLGWTSQADTIDAQPIDTRTDYYAGYIQDNWKVTPNLTVNLGLRWEMDTPRWERENRQSGFDLHQINPVSGNLGVVTFSGRDGRSKYAHDYDRNDFAPRVGFAYRAPGGLVLRGGYGIQYLGPYGFITSILTQGFSNNQTIVSPDGGFTPALRFRDGMPPPPSQADLGPGFGAVVRGATPRIAPDLLQQNHRTGYMQQWNLGIQRQLSGNMLFEVAYLGNVGHKLGTTRNISLNMIPLVNGMGPAQQDQQLRPFPQFSDVLLNSPPWGNSSYHSLNLKLEKRYSSGLNFLMNYTWSKFIDDSESTVEIGGEQGGFGYGYTHIELRHLDKGLSGNDMRQRYVGSVVYELPFGRGRRWNIENAVLEKLAGGWGIGLITELQDGVPYSVLEETNRSNTFSRAQRPNLLRDPDLGDGRPRSEFIAEYFETEAFVAPGVGIFGSAPRTVCCGPGAISIDLSVQKKFVITERTNLSFRTDFLNFPNLPNFAHPELRRGNSAFGRISSIRPGSTGRLIQFNLRLEF